jgi:diphthamide biosynthesis protein 3
VFQRDQRDKKQTECKMSYDDVEIEDMEWNEEMQAFTYPCPCGDLFQITKEDPKMGEEIARCPSYSLYITVIYNLEDFQGRPPPPPRKKTGPPKGTTTLITVA